MNHPNIVTIYDTDAASGCYFIAMEYIEGQSLDRLIPRKGMRLADVLLIQFPKKLHDAYITARDCSRIELRIMVRAQQECVRGSLWQSRRALFKASNGCSQTSSARHQF